MSEYARPDRERRSVTQLLATAIPFAVFWYLRYRSLEVGCWLTLILAVPTTGFMTRLFMIQHDRGHGPFLHSRCARDVPGLRHSARDLQASRAFYEKLGFRVTGGDLAQN